MRDGRVAAGMEMGIVQRREKERNKAQAKKQILYNIISDQPGRRMTAGPGTGESLASGAVGVAGTCMTTRPSLWGSHAVGLVR